ncbi:unnamed protein product [Brassicogethes aeneus]|uniref:Uncharacterized protein n=1 Tax=Brassicogethes aeneus TaxID=1431903 RepID=A0A9P0FMH1_BRAAE|nr:unnamed protein product [Brassicogethes aeneus]
MFKPFQTFKDDNYLVELQKDKKVCFGTSQERSTDPIGNKLAPHQKRNAPELNPKIQPGSYYNENDTFIGKLENKIRSVKGVGFFASNSERFQSKFQRTPSPTRYELMPKPKKKRQIAAPFNSKSIYDLKTNNNPGPGTYNLEKISQCRRIKFFSNFGHPKMIPCVQTYCQPTPSDVCHKCKDVCTKDYWHNNFATFLCHLCWMEEKTTQEIHTLKELKEFKKIRDCSYVHSHEGTSVANRIMTKSMVLKRQRLENYLDLYISCFD